MKLKPGQKVIVVEKDGFFHMIPKKPISKMRGSVKGVNTENLREEAEPL